MDNRYKMPGLKGDQEAPHPLTTWRFFNKISYGDMAEMLGIQARTLWRIEVKGDNILLDTAAAIVKLTEGYISYEDLISQKGRVCGPTVIKR